MPATTPAASPADADLRRLAMSASLIAIIAVFIVFAALLASLDALVLIEPFVRSASTGDWGLFGSTLVALIHKLAPLIPTALYLLAVLGAAGILDHIGKAEYFSPRNIRALGDMGGAMLWGAFWAVFLVPSLGDWTGGTGGYRVNMSPEPLVIGTIGLCLLVMGRLFLRAQKLESEIEGIV